MVPSWVTEVVSSYRDDPMAQDLLAKFALDSTTVPEYSLESSLLRYHNRIWIGSDPELQKRLLTEFHSSAWGGHSGILVTYSRLKQCFTWSGMKAAVKNFVQSCSICQ